MHFVVMIRHICSRYCLSVSSKVASSRLSMSRTATTWLVGERSGTTISERERLLQAMWPGNCSTSGTTMVRCSFHAVPQTPRP